MSETFEHLRASTRPLAREDDVVRINDIRTDRWIDYTRATQVLDAWEDLLSFPKRTRMPNALLVGATNSGKSQIIEKFVRTHLPMGASCSAMGVLQVPVLNVQLSSGPDEPRFFGSILRALGCPDATGGVAKLQDKTLRMMRETGVQLLVLDEVHNVLSGSRLQQRRMLNLLRWLGNELKIPLIGVGTAEAFHAIQSDDQLANRFEPMTLPPWPDGNEYRQLLLTLEAVLPLRRASSLAKDSVAGKIHAASGGILGEIVTIVTRSAVQAIRCGSERITAKLIDQTGYLSPRERRRVAV